MKLKFACFAGEKNDDPNHPGTMCQANFSFLKSPVKAKMKHDLIRYHQSEEIKAKGLKSIVSHAGSIVDVGDTEDSNSDDQEPSDARRDHSNVSLPQICS